MIQILTNTHIFIGKRVWEIVENEPILYKLNKRLFVYGNVKPDVPFQNIPLEHKREEALPFVLEKIDELKNMELSSKIDIDIFSLNLGIICHFLSDFYCMPHVQRWGDYKGIKRAVKGIEHICYEFKISFHKDEIRKVVKNKYYSISNPEEFILDSFEMYKNDINLRKDVYYATLVCNSIVNYILLNQKTFMKS